MNIFQKIYNGATKHSKVIKIVLACVLSVSFVGSMAHAVLSGGELTQQSEENPNDKVKGMMKIKQGNYKTDYIAGDQFVFDKENTIVELYVKDPNVTDLIVVEDLEKEKYGFQINGEGDVISDPSSIVIDKTITKIDVVSIDYPTIKTSLNFNVLGSIDSTKLSNELLLEAEKANIYQNDQLLDAEALKTKPATDKPFISNEGTTKDGLSCSGGAALRNFGSYNMSVEFVIIANKTTEVDLSVLVCKRKENTTFGSWYKVEVNGTEFTGLKDQAIASDKGYFNTYELQPVKVSLSRGMNRIVFKSGTHVGTKNPGNLDAIKIKANENAIGDISVIVE